MCKKMKIQSNIFSESVCTADMISLNFAALPFVMRIAFYVLECKEESNKNVDEESRFQIFDFKEDYSLM